MGVCGRGQHIRRGNRNSVVYHDGGVQALMFEPDTVETYAGVVPPFAFEIETCPLLSERGGLEMVF